MSDDIETRVTKIEMRQDFHTDAITKLQKSIDRHVDAEEVRNKKQDDRYDEVVSLVQKITKEFAKFRYTFFGVAAVFALIAKYPDMASKFITLF